ncbi:unnamed protein product [Ilex paraguariensis]|uniref:Uncharacterized protein n=1 Tax=Ilex paraguariensis TaxID=185542 RepID=A0ABC8TER2_9AQUA
MSRLETILALIDLRMFPVLSFSLKLPGLLQICVCDHYKLQGEKLVMVACGWRHTISVSSSGGLYTYGWSKYGQLGHGDFADHLIPHKLEALRENVISQVISYSSWSDAVLWNLHHFSN